MNQEYPTLKINDYEFKYPVCRSWLPLLGVRRKAPQLPLLGHYRTNYL